MTQKTKQCWVLGIHTTQEAEIRRIWFEANNSQDPISKIPNT
jgi:hypothetical protein